MNKVFLRIPPDSGDAATALQSLTLPFSGRVLATQACKAGFSGAKLLLLQSSA
jgi:hypothetical protein